MSNGEKCIEMFERHGLKPSFSLIGDGWVPLVDKLITDMKALGWTGEVEQVKEKFGTLRFYYSTYSNMPEQDFDKLDNLVLQAEQASAHICENCGAPAKTKDHHGWLSTLCDPCDSKY